MDAELVPKGVTDIFLAQGLIGAVALLALLAVAFLYRSKELSVDKVTNKYEAALKAQSERYLALLAAKDAAMAKVQEERVTEMKSGMGQLAAANQTVDRVTAGFEIAVEALSKRSAR